MKVGSRQSTHCVPVSFPCPPRQIDRRLHYRACGRPMRRGGRVMAYELPPLPYPYNALEPYIDEETMRIHHDKHHGTYVTNVNNALANHPDLAALPVEQLIQNLGRVPEDIRTTVRNNGGGHANHSFFWPIMAPNAGGQPTGALMDAIAQTFGGFGAFKDQFSTASTSGSMPTTSSTRTDGRSTSRRGGTS